MSEPRTAMVYVPVGGDLETQIEMIEKSAYDAVVKERDELERKLNEVDPLIPKALLVPGLFAQREELYALLAKLRPALLLASRATHEILVPNCGQQSQINAISEEAYYGLSLIDDVLGGPNDPARD